MNFGILCELRHTDECRFALNIDLIMIAEFSFTLQAARTYSEIIAKSIAILFRFSIANDVATLFHKLLQLQYLY